VQTRRGSETGCASTTPPQAIKSNAQVAGFCVFFSNGVAIARRGAMGFLV
jgi:hypothetical protein